MTILTKYYPILDLRKKFILQNQQHYTDLDKVVKHIFHEDQYWLSDHKTDMLYILPLVFNNMNDFGNIFYNVIGKVVGLLQYSINDIR